MSRWRSLALVGLLVLSTASVAVGPATGDGIVIVSTETTPERPAPGENVMITTTVTNPDGNDGAYELRFVEIRETTADDSTLYNASNHRSSVGVGETVSRDLSVEIEESGEQTFIAHVQILSGGQVLNFERAVTVTAGQPDPAMSLSADPVGPSGDTAFALNVSNPRTDAIRSLSVDLGSESVAFDENRRLVSQLGSGSTVTLRYPASNVAVGEKTVTADIEYTTADGQFVSTTQTLSTTVDRVQNAGNVTLSGVEMRNVGGELRLSGQADNVGGTAVSSVRIAATGEHSLGDVQSRTFVGSIAASESREFGLSVAVPEGGDAATIPITVRYLVDGEEVSRTLSVSYEPGSNGDVSLSDVDIVTRNGESRIVGEANNIGDTNVSSFRISVAKDAYSLGDAQSRTFVGNLEPGGSGGFELATALPRDGEAATIPLSVSYSVDGQQVTRSISVEHRPRSKGNVDLTGVRIEQAGDRLTVRGSTSNLGTTNASAVVVSIGESEFVAPAQSEASYFVGTIQRSDFKSFQVDARLTADTNETISIPVEVGYRIDGQRVTQTITVPYTPRQQVVTGQSQRSAGLPLTLVGGALVVLVVAGLAYRRYR